MYDANELTGWEEHLRDEATECGELAAMRREAKRDARTEAAMIRAEQEEEEREWKAQQANPLRSVCSYPAPYAAECRFHDPIPF